MSLEVLLIPIGIAALGALAEARSSDLCTRCKATRVTDPTLLHQALLALGAQITTESADRIRASSQHGPLTFQRVGGVFLGRVDDADDAATTDMLAHLDSAVGRIVQSRTAQLLQDRARTQGFRLIEQTADDGSLNFVFEEI